MDRLSSSPIPAPDSTDPASPADCLMLWLCLPDEMSARVFLTQHHAILHDPMTIAMLARWIAEAPPALAHTWAQRLAWLRTPPPVITTI